MNPFSGTFLIRSRPEILVAADIPAETGRSHGRIGCKAEGKLAGLCNGGPEGVASSEGRRRHGKSPKIEKYEEKAADRRKDLSPAGAGVFLRFPGRKRRGRFFAGQTIKRGNRA